MSIARAALILSLALGSLGGCEPATVRLAEDFPDGSVAPGGVPEPAAPCSAEPGCFEIELASGEVCAGSMDGNAEGYPDEVYIYLEGRCTSSQGRQLTFFIDRDVPYLDEIGGQGAVEHRGDTLCVFDWTTDVGFSSEGTATFRTLDISGDCTTLRGSITWTGGEE